MCAEIELEFDDIGVELSPVLDPGFSAGSFEGRFGVDLDGYIHEIRLRLSKYDRSTHAWVYRFFDVDPTSLLFRQLSERIAAVYAGDIADAVHDYVTSAKSNRGYLRYAQGAGA